MEKVIRFSRDERRTIVRGLYDIRNTMGMMIRRNGIWSC